MLQYTQATLHTALTLWNVNSDPDFVNTLPEIVKRGEIRLSRALDLDSLDTVNTAVSTVAATATVTKPATLINERSVTVLVAAKDTQLIKRSRAWVKLYNSSGAQGTPKYYCETNETTWTLAPIPAGVYPLTIQGNFIFASIEDGATSSVTWFSTQVPDLLYYACSIEACEFLKAWAKKQQNQADFALALMQFTGIARTLQRTDSEDIVGERMSHNQPGTQG
jgi:hypothetical protein